MYSSMAYAPFGEQYSKSGTADPSFTGQNSDTVPSLYDFTFREHSMSQGRWILPDPLGVAAVDPTTPQTWNRYAYVANNPLSFVDPSGLNRGFPGQCQEGQGLCPDEGAGADADSINNGSPFDFCDAMGNCSGNTFEQQAAGLSVIFAAVQGSEGLVSPIFDFHADSGGYMVGDFPGEIYCSPILTICTMWNPNTQQWEAANNEDPTYANRIHALFQTPETANIWQQANCTVSGPATEAITGVADGAAFDAFKGAVTATSAGTSVAKGVVSSLEEGTFTFLFGVYSYGKMMGQMGWNMVMGCKGD